MPLFNRNPRKNEIRQVIGRLDIPPHQVFEWPATVDNEPGNVTLERLPHRADRAKRYDTFNLGFLGRTGTLTLVEVYFLDRSGEINGVLRAYTDPIDALVHDYREAQQKMLSQIAADVAHEVTATDYTRAAQMLNQAPEHPSLQTGPIVGE